MNVVKGLRETRNLVQLFIEQSSQKATSEAIFPITSMTLSQYAEMLASLNRAIIHYESERLRLRKYKSEVTKENDEASTNAKETSTIAEAQPLPPPPPSDDNDKTKNPTAQPLYVLQL
jgi:hypothetical protein